MGYKKNITQEEKCYSVEFHVSEDMCKQFVNLIGDRSSLHTDKAFIRRSMYRKSVVHGMLPIIFISALKICRPSQSMCYFSEISARFLKPIFVNDKLLLEAKIFQANEDKKQTALEYMLKKAKTGTVLTAGNFTLRYIDSIVSKNQKHRIKSQGFKQHIVIDSLVENNLRFEQICKGDEKSFQFLLSREHACTLHRLLTRGFLSDYKLGLSSWLANFDSANLLSTCLFSTFAGMCIPGRHTTFVDFKARFNRPIQWNKKYLFIGKVAFKSQSVSTIVENISIIDPRNKAKLSAEGKISAKVNEPPTKMPSIEFLRNKELDLELKDKVVLITGASRGIGETTAKLFSIYGAKIIINYFHGEEDAKRIANEIIDNEGDAIAIQADVSDKQQVKQMISTACKKYGTIHILVNNAVRDAYPMPFAELAWEDLQKDIDVTVKGPFNCCQEVLPLMRENKSGKIVNISTVFTDNPPPDQVKYVVTKSGLVGLTRSLAVEFAAYNIQVNMVVPSIVETDLSKHVPKMFLEAMKNNTPMKRNATPADVAKAVVFLSSSLASFTTGQKVMVTGGNPPFL